MDLEHHKEALGHWSDDDDDSDDESEEESDYDLDYFYGKSKTKLHVNLVHVSKSHLDMYCRTLYIVESNKFWLIELDGCSGMYREELECNCGCEDHDDPGVQTEEEETEFGPDKEDQEMLL